MGQVCQTAWTTLADRPVAPPVGRPTGRQAIANLCLTLMVAASLLAALLGSAGQAATPKFPALTGRIVDDANILSAYDKAQIETTLKALDAKSSDQLVVVTVRSLNGIPIEDYGYQLGRFWKIGQTGTNNGVLLIVAPNERKVRIEVGRGLEPIMTDTMSKIIIDNAILPAFRRGDFPGGIRTGVRDMTDVLLGDAEAVKLRAKSIRKPVDIEINLSTLLFVLFWVSVVIYSFYQQQKQASQLPAGARRGRRRYGDNSPIIVPGGWGGSGGWSSGGSSSGGSSDGGFSGGGGDFGGGGSSGSW